ncbi:helix-turn-helix domain-containing protein [Rossellomorea sp. RS05]|uniref:helix-turn-helix domain-containing protein n=1 Tax=Rossellomorea sp. RS05 TaxID=3149166 RepID=UPI0032219E62
MKNEAKKYPYEINEYYSPGLNSLKRIYTKHPKFNGNTRLIYELIFDYWNDQYGYAFPTHYDLARDSGISVASVKTQIKTLTQLDLLQPKKADVNGRKNNVYLVKQPVRTIDEFYRKFPEVRDQAVEKLRKIDAEEQSDKSRWAGWKATESQPKRAEDDCDTEWL